MKNLGKKLAVWAIGILGVQAYSPEVIAGGPVPIKKCETITEQGFYVLDGNISAEGDCLLLATDFVTIDLNGFAITGNGTGSAIRTFAGSRTGIIVRDGRIIDFNRGIDLAFDADQVLIEQMHLIGNSDTGAGVNSLSIVKDSTFFDNGIGLVAGSRNLVTGNISSHNSVDGIRVGVSSTVVNNTTGVNGSVGIRAQCPSNLIGNTSLFNGTNVIANGCQSVDNLF